MTYVCKIADIDAMPLLGFDWQLRTGLGAPIQGWAVPSHIADQVVKQYPDDAVLRRRAYFHTLDLTKASSPRARATDRTA